MKHYYLENRELKDALVGYSEFLKPLIKAQETEVIPVSDALGRITASACFAKISNPHYNACAMDGIAVRAIDTFSATELTPVTLEKDQFVMVDTGDPVPDGFDAVVMIEDVILKDERAVLYNAVYAWKHVRQIGEDLCKGDIILPSYTELNAAAIGALLSGGLLQVEVFKKLKVGVIPTGDELIPIGVEPKNGDIIEFNSHMLKAGLLEENCEVKTYDIVKDEKELLKKALLNAVKESDIVLLNAGSSAGRDDYTKQIIEESGSVFCHGIAIKPGKPTILGALGHVPVIGLPGYPVSAMVVLENVVYPVIELFTKNTPNAKEAVKATVSRRVISNLKYQEYLRVKLGIISGKLVATPMERGAGSISSLAKADGMLKIPFDSEGLEAGQEAQITLLRPMEEIEKALLSVGSHDPMLDVLGDIMRRKTDFVLSGTHVGSMGGIMAIMRGEAHIAPIHLLDTESGEYNKSYMEKHLAGKATLIKGIKRTQGILVKKGNPKGIAGILDLQNSDIIYVNRQKGAGTRILFDFLLKQNDMTYDKINGYENEEYTHTAVAAQIAGGNADAGMGIYSAAKIFDLDFIPIADEEYDFLVSIDMQENPKVQAFIEILQSNEMKDKLYELGGYKTD